MEANINKDVKVENNGIKSKEERTTKKNPADNLEESNESSISVDETDSKAVKDTPKEHFDELVRII